MIPKLIHQTWKTNNIPKVWQPLVTKVQTLNPGWSYKLWTDDDNDEMVKKEYPEFYEIFSGFPRNIMKADVIRYLIMYKFGGVYLDLDYEVLKPFNFENRSLVLPLEKSIKDGAAIDQIGNCIFASVPGHKFWKDVIDDLKINPPTVSNVHQITETTGPQLLTRIFHSNLYNDIYTPDKIVYHPEGNVANLKIIKTNGISLGIHHTWSSWRGKGIMNDLKHLIKYLFRRLYYDNF